MAAMPDECMLHVWHIHTCCEPAYIALALPPLALPSDLQVSVACTILGVSGGDKESSHSLMRLAGEH